MTRTIVTARHAATGNAARHVINGTFDEPLSELGRRQVLRLVERHGRLAADLVISSPLSRCLETATLLTGLGAERIQLWKSCIDRNYGLLQGMPPEGVATLRPTIRYIRAGDIDHSVNPPKGETLGQVRARARRVATRLARRPEPAILLFSHQAFLQQLHGVLMGLSLRQALALDIQVLQVDEFTVAPGLPTARRTVYPGEAALRSW